MRFAFLILGPRFEPERDRAAILDGTAQIVGVPTVEQWTALSCAGPSARRARGR